MSNSSDQLSFALLATLEADAKKKGKKSVAKRVASRLRKAGANSDLITQVEALGGRKSAPAAVRPSRAKHPRKAKVPAKSTSAAQPTA